MTDITVYRGDTEPIPRKAKSHQTANGVLDITGWSFTLTVNTEENPTNTDNQLFQATASLTNPTAGDYEFRLTTGQADQTPGTYYFDIQYVKPGGEKGTQEKGLYIVEQDINKD